MYNKMYLLRIRNGTALVVGYWICTHNTFYNTKGKALQLSALSARHTEEVKRTSHVVMPHRCYEVTLSVLADFAAF